MKSKKIVATLLTLVIAGSVFVGCKKNTPSDNGDKTKSSAPQVLDYYVGDEPETLDAQKMSGAPDMFLENMFLEGLTRFGKEEGKYEPGVAKEWKFDEASNTWTFTLRNDAVWSNGEKVTANDFFFAWRRALEEQTVYSFMLSDYIKGADEYAATTKKSYLSAKDPAFKDLLGKISAEKDADKKKALTADRDKRIEAMTDAEKADYKKTKDDLWSKVAVKADGDKLSITLSKPCPYFVGLTAFAVYHPMNEKFFNEHPKDYTMEAVGLLSNGPWKMSAWTHDQSFKLEKNDNYWNKKNINLSELNIKIVKDVSTRTNLLETGKLDGSAIQSTDLKKYQDKGARDNLNLSDMVDMPDYTVFYFDFNQFNNKYTMNANIRKAFMYALNRQEMVDKISIGDTAALSVIPPFFPGLSKAFREENGAKLFEDNQTDKAKEFLAAGLKELGIDKLPKLSMLIDTGDISKNIATKWQQDLSKIGVEIELVPIPWSEKLTRLKSGDFALCSDGWGPDYLDPMTFLDLFESSNGNNYGKYNNAAYDKLIADAKAETDKTKRMDNLYKAEKQLIEDAVICPTYDRTAHWTYKNYLTDVVNRGAGPSTDFYWANIDMDQKKDDQAKYNK